MKEKIGNDDGSYDDGDNFDNDLEGDDENYITPISGELATKEEVNKVDLDVVMVIPSDSKLHLNFEPMRCLVASPHFTRHLLLLKIGQKNS